MKHEDRLRQNVGRMLGGAAPVGLPILGLLLLVTAMARAAAVPYAPRAPAQAHAVYLPFVVRNHPPPPPLYRLYADPADLDWLAQDPYRNETIPATFCAPSTPMGAEERCWEVRLRYRGDLSRLMPKKSWKLFFPAADPFQGQTELNLNADYPDPTLLRSSLAYSLFREVGVPAPQTAFVRLAINDAYAGLYVQVEQVDERFLQEWGFETHGNLYKPYYGGLHREEYDDPAVREWWYRYRYPKKTNRESGIEDIVAFIELINGSSDETFPQAIAATLDVNEWVDWYAVNVLIGNFEMIEKNYYLYHDFSTDRWTILPWDVDITFGLNVWGTGVGGALDSEISWDNPIDSGTWESKKYDGKWNALIDRMMAVPEFRAFYCRRLRELMETLFSPDHLFPRIDAAFAYIRPWAEADPNRWQPEGFTFADGPAQLKDYITGRIAFLEGEMARFCPDRPVPLRINEFMADNDRTAADEAGDYDDWIELYNPSLLTWDLGGMYLTDDLSRTRRWRIPTGTLIAPGGTLLFWADDEEGEGPLHTNFKLSAGGEQIGLFDRDVHGNGPVDLITYTAQTTDRAYGRWPDGGEAWRVFDDPTPGWRNEGRPPQITGTAHTPTWPTAHDRVTVTTFVRDDGPALTVTLWYRAYVYGEAPPDYQPVPMADDGAHGDGAAGDGRFGAVIPFVPHREGYWVEYFVEAEDAAGMVSQDRPGWPQGDYRYITGWQRPPLFINEVLALNTRTLEDEAGEHDDWVEVYNAGPVDLDLGGMFLTDNLDQPDLGNLGDPHLYQVPTGTIVPAGGYLILWADGDGQGSHLSFRLSSAGEYLGLFDRADRFYAPVDAVYFPPQEPDRSWGRFPDGGGAWYAMAAPTPGGPNLLRPPRFVTVTRTPRWPEAGQPVTVTAVVTADSPALTVTLWYSAGAGFQPLPMVGQDGTGAGYRTYTAALPAQPDGTLVAYFLAVTDSVSQSVRYPADAPAFSERYRVGYTPPTLVINEILADNASVNQDEAGEYDDWVEIYNTGAVTVTLAGFYLTDDLTEPTKWAFPAGTVIPPGGYLLVWCDNDGGQGPLHAAFKLSRDGEAVGLFSDVAHGLVPLDWVVFGPQQEDVSYGRRPDGTDGWTFLDPPTPGEPNGYLRNGRSPDHAPVVTHTFGDRETSRPRMEHEYTN